MTKIGFFFLKCCLSNFFLPKKKHCTLPNWRSILVPFLVTFKLYESYLQRPKKQPFLYDLCYFTQLQKKIQNASNHIIYIVYFLFFVFTLFFLSFIKSAVCENCVFRENFGLYVYNTSGIYQLDKKRKVWI